MKDSIWLSPSLAVAAFAAYASLNQGYKNSAAMNYLDDPRPIYGTRAGSAAQERAIRESGTKRTAKIAARCLSSGAQPSPTNYAVWQLN